MYSYGGFEAALIVSGETCDARKDIPIALVAAIAATTLLFVSVQHLVVHTVANVASSGAPAVDSARRFLSPLGVHIVAAGTLISAMGIMPKHAAHAADYVCHGRARPFSPAALALVNWLWARHRAIGFAVES